MIADTLPALLTQRAASRAPALIDRGHTLTFTTLADESRRAARGLRSLGVVAGDRIAIWLPNVPAWLATFFACAQLGAIAVSINTRFRSHELADILRRSRAKVLVFWPGFKGIDFAGALDACEPAALEHLESIVAYGETKSTPFSGAAGKWTIAYTALVGGAPLAESSATPRSGCAVFTTSGTTKAPKFVLHDQRTVIAHAADVARGFGIDASSTVLCIPPFCGVFGFNTAMAAIFAGRPTVIAPAWEPEQAARDIVAHGVTHANGTDEAAAQLLAVRGADFTSVRFFGYAAFNPAHADIVRRADARGLRLVGLYGMSEVQALFARQDENMPASERMLGGGRPVSGLARVRARDPETGEVLEHGAQGELEFVAPSSRMVEYLGDAEATRKALTDDGFFRSGDLGYTLADGRFIYLARIGDALRLGGFLVSPAEIEAVVQEAPGIAACQVVGVARPEGNRAVAFVIAMKDSSFSEAEVLSHVRGRLAAFKVPLRVFPIDAFPVTPGANATKIQKGKLRELAVALLN